MIELKNVSKSIKNKLILDDISIQLEDNNIYGFYGRNASGKTMLFRAIAGLIIPDSGTITVFGERLGIDTSFPSSMGIVIENVGMWKHLTGYENLKLLADIRKLIGDEEIKNAMIRVGLDPDDSRRYGAFSLGMKQKLAIAQALMEKPRLIILDEPTNSLDESSVTALRKVMLEEKGRGATILIASHNRDDIRILCDYVYMVDSGKCKVSSKDA